MHSYVQYRGHAILCKGLSVFGFEYLGQDPGTSLLKISRDKHVVELAKAHVLTFKNLQEYVFKCCHCTKPSVG